MEIESYLAKGGKLTSPANVPPRYRGELLRLMATFIDSELAGAAGFADTINAAPGIAERIAAARITAEKTAHAGRVLRLMADFGADTARYARHHPWTARLPREADIAVALHATDMRLSVFHYPLLGWVDAVVMNVLMGRATVIQLTELTRLSYQPLADTFRDILPAEIRHADLGEAGLSRICATDDGHAQARAACTYWQPRVAASFGADNPDRFALLKTWGLRHRPNADLRAEWTADITRRLARLDLA